MSRLPTHKPLYRYDLFHPTYLISVEGVQNTVDEVSAILNEENAERVLLDLLDHEKPFALPLVLSAVEDYPLRSTILSRFPTTAVSYPSSSHFKLLSFLSDFFLLRNDQAASDFDTRARLREAHNVVKVAPEAVRIITKFVFGEDEDTRSSPDLIRPKKSQKTKTKARRATDTTDTINSRPFNMLGVSTPRTSSDVGAVERSILDQLKEALKLYFDLLRGMSDVIIEECVVVPVSVIPENDCAEDPADVPGAGAPQPAAEEPAGRSVIKPMKATLYFEDVEGFGDWKILVNTSAIAVLRSTLKKDAATYKLIMKKLRQLSRGHFFPNNQKTLEGMGGDIPVYEAKLSRDLRIIYQTDLLPCDDARGQLYEEPRQEKQAIKIIDVCTHTQMDGRLREAIKRQLIKKGKEYRKRCAKRIPADRGGNVFVPAIFPPLPEEIEAVEGLPDLPFDDPKYLHTRFVMEKFVSLSKPLLNSIMADLDITFPHLVSSQEKDIIEHPYSCYVLGRSGTGKTTTMLFKMLVIERGHVLASADAPRPRQLFVTQSRVLAGKVQEYFSKLTESLKVAGWTVETMEANRDLLSTSGGTFENLIDADDKEIYQSDLPECFSDLHDEHFPVITTVDRLWSMLEMDIVKSPDTSPKKRRVITYNVFLRDYWSHFTQSLVKHLDPALVFSEIMGVIKGSEATLADGCGQPLQLDDYENMSSRNYSTFAGQRANVFAIFEQYTQRKTFLGDMDAADRTHSILGSIRRTGLVGQGIDYLYVDEVQDNLLIDTSVLRALCCNPDGLFWAGDTAQTISVGSSFRFNDLKAFQYRIEEKQTKVTTTVSKKLVASQSQKTPDMFQLAVNYRSHAGIVDCAHSVIHLITMFWPNAIDALAPEKGVVDGMKPVWFSGREEDTMELEEFLFGDSGNPIEFGAQQCIIVRDSDARKRLQAQVGDGIGLIMTIYESKGLEFNDVLLFDFFRDSTVDKAQWRVILNALKDERDDISAPTFDAVRHVSVCVELKFLYVAITRARENLWIADQSPKGEPMKTFWSSRRQVQVVSPGTNMPRLAASSTKEEWAQAGNKLFVSKKYRQAKHCFARASLPDREREANAHFLREEAQRIPAVSRLDKIARSKAFAQAAEQFNACAEFTRTEDAKDHYLRICGECFEEAGEKALAANIYVKCKMYNRAVEMWTSIGMFNEALSVMNSFPDSISHSVRESLKKRAKLHYFKRQEFKRARALFEDDEEVLKYLEDRGLNESRATLLESLGRTVEAAELYLEEGQLSRVVELLLNDRQHPESLRKAAECICQALWSGLSFAVTGTIANDLLHFLELSHELDNISVDHPSAQSEIVMFRTIASGSFVKLRDLGYCFLQQRNLPAALLCLDHYFASPPSLQHLSNQSLLSELHAFQKYARLLCDITYHRDPCNYVSILKLFGVQRVADTDGQFRLPVGTYLHRQYLRNPARGVSPDMPIFLSSLELAGFFRRSLSLRLKSRIFQEDELVKKAQTLSPCLNYVLSGFQNCPRTNCPDIHLPSPPSSQSYNERVRLHLLQLEILQLSAVDYASEDFATRRRYWIGRLYNALNPPVYSLGTIASLDVQCIPNGSKGFHIAKDWIRNVAYTLDFYPRRKFLTDLLRTITLGVFIDPKEADLYLSRGKYIVRFPPREYIRPEGRGYIVEEAIAALQATTPWSINDGVLTFCHIIKQRLPIDIGVFCDFLDFLCASIIVSARLQGSLHSLHGLTAPQSWIIRYLNPSKLVYRHCHFMVMLTEAANGLLEQIYLNQSIDHLLFGHRNITNLPVAVQCMYMARICRAISLMGHNIPEAFELRETILAGFDNLRRCGEAIGHGFHHQYAKYVRAGDWSNLAEVLQCSLMAYELDEMVQLLDAKYVCGQHHEEIKGLRRVVFKAPADIPHLLSMISTTTAPPAPSKVATPQTVNKKQPDMERSQEQQDITRAKTTDDAGDDVAPEMTANQSIAEKVEVAVTEKKEKREEEAVKVPQFLEDQVIVPSDKEYQAATMIQRTFRQYKKRKAAALIQRAYRQYKKRIHPVYKSKRGEALYQWYSKCSNEAAATSIPRPYSFSYLGPLPHALFSLDIVYADAVKHKSKVKKRLSDAQASDLEEIDDELTRVTAAQKKISRLQKSLAPTSDVHRRGNIGELKGLMKEACQFIRDGLPFTPSRDLKYDLSLAMNEISTEHGKRKGKSLPQLNVEDL